MNAPDITAVGRTSFGGDYCSTYLPWTQTISWTVTAPDDTLYRLDIDEAIDAAGTAYAAMATNLSTATGTIDHDTGVSGNAGGTTGPTTYYRKYKVKIIRRSDSAVIDFMETTQGTATFYRDLCA
jgi:hypothetical protein